MGVLAEEKTKDVVNTAAVDTFEGKARFLLECMAVAKGVGIVEKATIPLKSLQKQVSA